MMVKRIVVSGFLLFFSIMGFSISLEDLTGMMLESNMDIKSARAVYEKEVLSAKYLNGEYTPKVSLSSSTTIPDEYDFEDLPDYFSSSVMYSQPFPGGTSVSLEAGIGFNSAKVEDIVLLRQQPNLSFRLSQSLMPFWLQGRIKDPVNLTAKQKEEYNYYQLLYTKKNIWISLLQYYVYALTSRSEIEINRNTIGLYETKINTIIELKKQGKASQSDVLELENSKWAAEQNLISAQSNYLTNIQNIKNICGQNFDDFLLEMPKNSNELDSVIEKIIDSEKDPLEQSYRIKLEILKSSRVIEKQSTAPMLSVSVQPGLVLNTTMKDDWQDAWENMDSPANWTVGIGIDFSAMLSGMANQNKKKYQINYNEAKESYNLYLQQRKFVEQQYEALLQQYIQQKEIVDSLYESGLQELKDYELQFERGEISKIDYESAYVRVENCRLKREQIFLYVCLYEALVKINSY